MYTLYPDSKKRESNIIGNINKHKTYQLVSSVNFSGMLKFTYCTLHLIQFKYPCHLETNEVATDTLAGDAAAEI